MTRRNLQRSRRRGRQLLRSPENGAPTHGSGFSPQDSTGTATTATIEQLQEMAGGVE